jgi:hypothetical protein
LGRNTTRKEESETFTLKYWFAPAQVFEVFRWFLGNRRLLYTMGFKHFCGKGPHLLLWAGSRDPSGKITIISGIFIAYTQFTNVALGWRPMLHTKRSVRVYKNSFIITTQTTSMSIIRNIQLILLRDIIGVDCEYHMKDANTHRG